MTTEVGNQKSYYQSR